MSFIILSDTNIREVLERGELKITDLDAEVQIGPCSIDLRLGKKFRQFKTSDHAVIDLMNYNDDKIREWQSDKDTKIEEYVYSRLYIADKPFILHPGEFVLAALHEHVEMPNNLIGRLDGRSSLGRLGLLVHSTAGIVSPGYRGYLTLELANVGKLPIKLYPGMRICQLVLQELKSPCTVPYGSAKGSKYLNDSGATQSKINVEVDIEKYKKQKDLKLFGKE